MFIIIVKNIILSVARKSDEMLEPYDGKLSRTVLRRERGSNPSDLVTYLTLASNFGGEIIKISNDTNTFFNPLDITMDYSGGDDEERNDNPLSFKTEFIFSFLDVVVTKESGIGLSGAERTLVDRTLMETYRNYFKNPKNGMPTLMDFCEELEKVKAPELQREKNNLLKVLGLYTTGSFNLFAHKTNVDVNNRFVVYDIKELGDQLKTLGMLVILDQIWSATRF